MTKDQLNQLINAKPFRPFKVFTTLGESFDILSKDHVMATRDTLLIGYDIDKETNVPEGFKHRGLDFIERTELIRNPGEGKLAER